MSVRLSAAHPRNEEPLEVGTVRPTSVGAIIQARPHLQFVLTWSHADFDRVWMMVLGGQLTHDHFYLTKPHYDSGLVVSASSSTELILPMLYARFEKDAT
jgi:hypothetical protein